MSNVYIVHTGLQAFVCDYAIRICRYKRYGGLKRHLFVKIINEVGDNVKDIEK